MFSGAYRLSINERAGFHMGLVGAKRDMQIMPKAERYSMFEYFRNDIESRVKRELWDDGRRTMLDLSIENVLKFNGNPAVSDVDLVCSDEQYTRWFGSQRPSHI